MNFFEFLQRLFAKSPQRPSPEVGRQVQQEEQRGLDARGKAFDNRANATAPMPYMRPPQERNGVIPYYMPQAEPDDIMTEQLRRRYAPTQKQGDA